MVRRVSFPSMLLLALVAALVGFARPAAAAIGPPWCGTPEPDAAEALPSTGTSFPHIPVYAIGCTLADIQSRSLDGRMSFEDARHVRDRPPAVQGRDQPAEDGEAEVGLLALDDPAPRTR